MRDRRGPDHEAHMRITFLEAADGTRLTKTFARSGEHLDIAPYPHIRNFTSHALAPSTLREFYDLATRHAAAGHSLLKGNLARQIANEPRAGLTATETPSDWVCLDFDAHAGFSSIDDMLEALHPSFARAARVVQRSASAGITGPATLRAHVFLRVPPYAPPLMKAWLTQINVTSPQLTALLELSASRLALRFPLDVTTCQNDKLIYVAPPICIGFDDPLAGQRWEYIEGDEIADFTPSADASRTQALINEHITTLRAAAGLPTERPKYRTLATGEVLLTNPAPAIVTGVKEARGFVYINLNGGDSWGYYIDPNRPNVVRNFKGEALLELSRIAPDLYAQLIQRNAPEITERRPFVFRHKAADVHYNALLGPNDTLHDLTIVSGRDKIRDFFAQYGEAPPEIIEDWDLRFDPTTTTQIHPPERWINRFNPPEHLMKPQAHTSLPDHTRNLLMHVCGTDEAYLEHFLNWLACAVQYRRKIGTTHLFSGTQGTGKGLLYSEILRPLFGPKHAYEVTMERFDEQFNYYLEDCLLLFVDEARVFDARSAEKTENKLKHLITETTVMIRAMRQNAYTAPSYTNLIFASNDFPALRIDAQDRRINVAPRQMHKITPPTPADLAALRAEIPLFAGYLMHREANMDLARVVLDNQARRDLIDANRDATDLFFDALRAGDLNYFIDLLKSDDRTSLEIEYHAFATVVRHLASHLGEVMKLPREALMSLYAYAVRGHSMTPAKFTRMCAGRSFPLTPMWLDERKQIGATQTFRGDLDRMPKAKILSTIKGIAA